MKTDDHESFHRMIDEGLAGAISAERERSLRRHLDTCSPCQQYLSACNRVIAGLGGFSFEVDPALNARVLASLRRRTQQVQARQPDRRRWVLIGVAAVSHQERKAGVHLIVHHSAESCIGGFQNGRCRGDGDRLLGGSE